MTSLCPTYPPLPALLWCRRRHLDRSGLAENRSPPPWAQVREALRLAYRRGAAGRNEHLQLTAKQIPRQHRQAIDLPFRIAKFDSDILPLDVALLFQSLTKGGNDYRRISRAPVAQIPDDRHRGLLRSRC